MNVQRGEGTGPTPVPCFSSPDRNADDPHTRLVRLPTHQPACWARAAAASGHDPKGQPNATDDVPEPGGRVLLIFLCWFH